MKSGTFTPATALMAGSAVLAALLAGLWFAPGAPERWRQWSAPEPQPPALDEVRQARLAFNPAAGAAYPGTVERPLFMSTRRPPSVDKEPAEPDKPPPQPIDQARVFGVIAGPALTGVMVEYEGQTRFVRPGEELGGWRVTSIQDRRVRLERNAERREIEVPLDSASAAAAAAAAPAQRSPARAAGRPDSANPADATSEGPRPRRRSRVVPAPG